MLTPIRGWRGRQIPALPRWGQDGSNRSMGLVRIVAEADPSAGAYGLLDPALGDEPELPRAGLLSQVVRAPEQAASEPLPIPAVKPEPPFRLSERERQGLIDRLIKREGGYVNDPDDPGGPTKFGVTQTAIDDYNRLMALEGGALLQKAPAAIDRAEAEAVHRKILSAYHFDQIQDYLTREHVFDMATNHGPGRSVLFLQEALNGNGYPVSVDGVLGPETRAALYAAVANVANRRRLNNELVRLRAEFYRELIRKDPTQKKFEKNWLERANSFRLLPPPPY